MNWSSDSPLAGTSHSKTDLTALLKTLKSRGWSFRDDDHVRAIITIQSALSDDSTCTVDMAEAQLLNMDLRSIGAKSLQDPSLLHGPIILQVSYVRDICRSKIDDVPRTSCKGRLLKLGLTDGYIEMPAVEYDHIPALSEDVVPGTKVRLEKNARIHSGILCLNPNVITVLGGVVQSLYDEWQMNKKYSGFSRSLRLSQETDTDGPPPFQKLQIGQPSNRIFHHESTSKSTEAATKKNVGKQCNNTRGTQEGLDREKRNTDEYLKSAPNTESAEEEPSSSTRPKEVSESVPVQNQAAAQKLLQKLSKTDDNNFREQRHKRREKQEERQFYTLDEWEKKKTKDKPPTENTLPDTSHDEDLARQLQEKFSLEDSYVQSSQEIEPEDLRSSMFSYERVDDRAYRGGRGGRGRGRGRGRSRGRGRYG